MGYTPPVVWAANGDVVNADDVKSNDDAMKLYINQGITSGDIQSASLDYDNIQVGEYDPISENMTFTTGAVLGHNVSTSIRNRAYFTSETKANNQVLGTQWQAIYDCCETVYNEAEVNATARVTFTCTGIVEDNSTTSAGPGRGKYNVRIILRHTRPDGTTDYVGHTRGWTFEGVGAPADVKDPGNDSDGARRQVGWSTDISCPPGENKLEIVVDPSAEEGFISARNFVVEVFYV